MTTPEPIDRAKIDFHTLQGNNVAKAHAICQLLQASFDDELRMDDEVICHGLWAVNGLLQEIADAEAELREIEIFRENARKANLAPEAVTDGL